ncbi:MAG TPA: DUF465 domain-containing protein [Accumulibacter sp.]|nr:DUF465 domain-containing protein [Accumulibacter sp.]HMW18016.1 DUF465 domain-containing protein [Accumulibacter sp.]HMX22946.1 DUF465 domain-containing protein [Accumulibacter sp.]HMY07246.1 DUF465 domain-containing protein [Accumulibacter sp.]HNC16528.1 DUF465 domain-containing protein [Accumulibacter sp.]
MQVEHHDLHHEFPEYLDSIQALKSENERFGQMFLEYEELTREVERLEEDDLPVDDFTIENMKKQRVRLKDQMYHMLRSFNTGR